MSPYHSGGFREITKIQIRGGMGEAVRRGGGQVTAEVRMMRFEDGARGHQPRNTGGLQKVKKARKQILP